MQFYWDKSFHDAIEDATLYEARFISFGTMQFFLSVWW